MGRLFLGTSGYVYSHWKGRYYPENMARECWFAHYCKDFNALEINYSYYKLPEASVVQKWNEEAPPSFTFCLKFSRFTTKLDYLLFASNSVFFFSKIWDTYEETKRSGTECMQIHGGVHILVKWTPRTHPCSVASKIQSKSRETQEIPWSHQWNISQYSFVSFLDKN